MKKILSILTAVFLAVMMVVPSFAYSGARFSAEMVTAWEDGYTYAIHQTNNVGSGSFMLMSTAPFVFSEVDNKYYATGSGKYLYYEERNDGTWQRNGSGTMKSGSYYYIGQPLWTSYDLLSYEDDRVVMAGEVNFTPAPPLAEQIQEVTEEELTEVTVPEIHRVIMVVVTVAVGCLASLMALALLNKRWFVS